MTGDGALGPVPGTVLEREAGRMLVFDTGGRILLLHGQDSTRPGRTWWFTPGGGAEQGESHEAAARRETLEETGIQVPWCAGPVLERRIEFPFEEFHVIQHERFYFTVVQGFDSNTADVVPDTTGWTAVEERSVLGLRWWTLRELRRTQETVYPVDLADVAEAAFALRPN